MSHSATPVLRRARKAAAAVLSAFSLLLLGGNSLAAGLVISPSTIANDYVGAVDFTITGLDSAGQTVVIEEYFDADGSNTVNAPDILLRRYVVTDGQVTSIGGQRNLNLPGDEDLTANSQIHTRINFSSNEIIGRIDGRHLFRVSPSGSGFAPVTTAFVVTQRDYSGSGISGTILGGSPQVGQVGALLLLFSSGGDHNLIAISVAGAGGNYSIKTAPGAYLVLATKGGFIVDSSAAPPVIVAGGSFVTSQNVILTAAQRTISGTLRDAVSLNGLAGVPMQGSDQAGFLSITLTDANGNFTVDAATGPWQLNVGGQETSRRGFLDFKTTESSAGNVTGFNYDLPRATSLIYGSLKTPANVPVPFAEIEGQTNGSPNLKSSAVTDANGNYSLGASPGSWNDTPKPIGYVAAEQVVVVNTAGSAVLQNLVAYPVTAHLRGQIRDNHNNPVGNVTILAIDTASLGGGGSNNLAAQADADANGNFDLGVFGGGGATTRIWQLQLNQNDNTALYVSTGPTFPVQDGVDTNGITYLVYVVTAHLQGQVLDENNAPIGNINVFATSGANGNLLAGSNADGGGNFDVALFAGSWQLGLSNISGLGLIPQDFSTTVTDGVDQSGLIFRARHTTTTIIGTVKSANNTPIAGVNMFASSTIGGATFPTSGVTDASGTYSLPVFSATWTAIPSGPDLISQGFQSVASQLAFVNTSSVTLNFVATPATFAGWGSEYFSPSELQNPLISGQLADPDGDGISNELEYALHLNPRSADASGLPTSGTLPSTGMGPYVTLTYRRLIGATDLTYTVQESTTLATTWGSATVASEDILGGDTTFQIVRARVLQGGAKKFLRLKVVKSP